MVVFCFLTVIGSFAVFDFVLLYLNCNCCFSSPTGGVYGLPCFDKNYVDLGGDEFSFCCLVPS